MSLDEVVAGDALGHSLPDGFDPSEWDEVDYDEDGLVAVRGNEIFVSGRLAQQMTEIARRHGVSPEVEINRAARAARAHVARELPRLRIYDRALRLGLLLSRRWRPRARAHRYRARRRVARTSGSRGDPPDDEPEPALRVIPPAEFRRAVDRALRSAA
jgi:hypothetical protein